MINTIKKKIFNYYNSLNSKQKLIWVVGILVFFMIIYYTFISSNTRVNDNINYDNFNLQDLSESYDIVYDRAIIYSLDEIISKILNIKNDMYYVNEEKVTIKDIYNELLTVNYKKNISYRDFEDNFNNFLQKINYNEYDNSQTKIDTVYFSDLYNMYLIKLMSTFPIYENK